MTHKMTVGLIALLCLSLQVSCSAHQKNKTHASRSEVIMAEELKADPNFLEKARLMNQSFESKFFVDIDRDGHKEFIRITAQPDAKEQGKFSELARENPTKKWVEIFVGREVIDGHQENPGEAHIVNCDSGKSARDSSTICEGTTYCGRSAGGFWHEPTTKISVTVKPEQCSPGVSGFVVLEGADMTSLAFVVNFNERFGIIVEPVSEPALESCILSRYSGNTRIKIQ